MANDNIQVEVLDSSSEFRPGRKGGSVNWMQLLSGVLLLVFGLVCVFCPFEVLMGISAIIAVCVIVAGGIGVASYVRYRNTLFSQSVWSLFFSVMIALLGVLLLDVPRGWCGDDRVGFRHWRRAFRRCSACRGTPVFPGGRRPWFHGWHFWHR